MHPGYYQNTMPNVQLFSYPTSPFAQKVGCYLKYKQIDFKLVPVNPLTNAEIAFTDQRQVPVLQIDGEWRKESSELGIWLDQRFASRPLLPEDQTLRQAISDCDAWISANLLPSIFRYAVEWQNPWYSISNGWRLSRAVNDATPLPFYVRLLWPFGVKRAPFIVRMVNAMNLEESIPKMNERLQTEFIRNLQGGPYLAGNSNPSLADFSAFPAIASGFFMGMKTRQALIDHPEIYAWSQRVYQHLPENPLLVPDRLLKRRLPRL